MEPGGKCISIIGAGPAGCMAAYYLQNDFEVTLFDFRQPLTTLLPTGGGRCNLAHAEYDFKELAKNYPRGEKFLYSVFSKFSTAETLAFFEKIGIKTYTPDDNRIFPVSNSAKDVRTKFLKALDKCKFVRQGVSRLDEVHADYIIIAVGGHSGYALAHEAGHTIIPPRPALTGLKTAEDFSVLSGLALNGILFTHEGVSGPLIYKISSLRARENFPYKINFDLTGEIDLQTLLNANPHKSIKNLIAELVPKSLAAYISGAQAGLKCHQVSGSLRDGIMQKLRAFEITVTGTASGGETVTCGGVCLDEVDAKTMRSKLAPNVYFCGEVLDIDGFCGGFNLQNCWSTGFAAAQGICHNTLNKPCDLLN